MQIGGIFSHIGMLLYKIFCKKESTMRKVVIIVGLMFLALALAGCKSKTHKTDKSSKKICAAAQPVMLISEDKG